MKYISHFIFFIILSASAIAQDRQFARVYQSNTLPKGAVDIEVFNTWRFGKKDFFSQLDQRAEFETGLTDRLQTSVYLNMSHNSFIIPGDSTRTMNSESAFSFSNEWKQKLSDPTINRIGSALYGELTLSPSGIEFEPKIILDKRIEKHLISFNVEAEFEYGMRSSKDFALDLEATPLSFYLGYMYNFSKSFGIGVEALNHYEIVNSVVEHAAILGGPSLYYTSGKTFFILNYLPQITNLNHAKVHEPLDLYEYEKSDIRLLFGLSF